MARKLDALSELYQKREQYSMVATRMVSCVAALLLVIVASSTPSAAAGSWSLPGCQATCGGVDIPYPFGIGPNCFRPGFEIACNHSTPFLAGTGYKVLNLSLAPSGARVEFPIAWICYDVSGGSICRWCGLVR
ncbi:hypothetical protein EJB05_07502, partial [Eragrostis curvula]